MKNKVVLIMYFFLLLTITINCSKHSDKFFIGQWELVGEGETLEFKGNGIWTTSDGDYGTWELINDTMMFLEDGPIDDQPSDGEVAILKYYSDDFFEVNVSDEFYQLKRMEH